MWGGRALSSGIDAQAAAAHSSPTTPACVKLTQTEQASPVAVARLPFPLRFCLPPPAFCFGAEVLERNVMDCALIFSNKSRPALSGSPLPLASLAVLLGGVYKNPTSAAIADSSRSRKWSTEASGGEKERKPGHGRKRSL